MSNLCLSAVRALTEVNIVGLRRNVFEAFSGMPAIVNEVCSMHIYFIERWKSIALHYSARGKNIFHKL